MFSSRSDASAACRCHACVLFVTLSCCYKLLSAAADCCILNIIVFHGLSKFPITSGYAVTDLTSKTCLDALIGAKMISPPFARCRVFKNSAGADRYGSVSCKSDGDVTMHQSWQQASS